MAKPDEIVMMLTLPRALFDELADRVSPPTEQTDTPFPPRPPSRPQVVKAALGAFLVHARAATPAVPPAPLPVPRQRFRAVPIPRHAAAG